MFNKTKLYSVYVKKDSKNPLDTAVFIKQGFNFFAFLLGPIWAIYNRLWLVFLALMVVTVLLEMNDKPEFGAISLILSVWFGFEASGYKARKLERKNYIIFDVVTGIDKLAAETRFYDKYLLQQKAAVKSSSFSFAS